jgi:hypothetical protein
MTSSNLLDFLYFDSSTQKLHTQFWKFKPPPFFMALEVFKEKSKKKNDNKKKNVLRIRN